MGILLLEDGRAFEGAAFGAPTTAFGEVVFQTAMTGFQEVLTDPSYREQVVVMTAAHVGNTGMQEDDDESAAIHVAGFVARRFTPRPWHPGAREALGDRLARLGVPALEDLDTRALVRHIREKGAMKAAISTDGTPLDELRARLDDHPGMVGRALAGEVSTPHRTVFADPPDPALRVAVLDGGVKRGILRLLAAAGCRVEVFPLSTPAAELRRAADAVLVSNGPGDPAALPEVVGELRALLGEVPLLGICLGHQLLARALGAETYKLRFGHRGANHPVRDLETGRVEITSQNHGFCVDPDGLRRAGAEITHLNLNDGTLEGFRHDGLRVMAVQFHPEASPGPRDSGHLLLRRFVAFAGGRPAPSGS